MGESKTGGCKVGPQRKERTKGKWRSCRSHHDSWASCFQADVSTHRMKLPMSLCFLSLFSATLVASHMCDPFLKPRHSASILKTQDITLKFPARVTLRLTEIGIRQQIPRTKRVLQAGDHPQRKEYGTEFELSEKEPNLL